MIKLLTFSLLSLLCIKQSLFGQNTSLKAIYFAKNKFTVDAKYKPLLKKLALTCKSDSTSHVKIIAYADKSGSEEYNDWLSKKRAYAVLNFMLAYAKIDSSKIYVTWIGKSDDVYDLHLTNAHFQKRCVDIWMQFNK